ncbi:MAG: radical SAM family heme chaperone HemW [Anaerolineae bacterium]|nr:radical SAM family heme chaperone HemW [Anaerolineae bacterium]
MPCQTTKPNHTPLSERVPDTACYFHIPFCRTRCSYCDFNTYTGQDSLIPHYMHALATEVRLVGVSATVEVTTLFFGGGTPSLIPANDLNVVLDSCRQSFELAGDAEISLEANPGTISRSYLYSLRQYGVNRLSIGMQSAHARELNLFERTHQLGDVRLAVEAARDAGFENISLDLIYGIPLQTLDDWRISLDTALDMRPDHLSLYALGVEDGTPLHGWIADGRFPSPDPDLAADMYEWASERLAQAGFEQYEISNWARPDFACQHNLRYWRNTSYLGFGAGAHGHAVFSGTSAVRYANVLHPADYIRRIQAQTGPCPFPLSDAVAWSEHLDGRQVMADTMFMGLRLIREGISPGVFKARFGDDLWQVYGAILDRLIAAGLVERTADERVRLTSRGRLLGNQVFAEFV